VNQIRAVTNSLGLLSLRIPNYLAIGFKPDLLVMCGPNEGDRIYIDAINTRASLNRDIGALLKLRANLDKKGILYRRIIAVCSDKIQDKDLHTSYALVETTSKFLIIRIYELKGYLNDVILEAIREKLEQINQERLEIYLEYACPLCGETYKTKSISDGEWECMKCGFRWRIQKKSET